MSAQGNLQKDILVMNMDKQLDEIARNMFKKEVSDLSTEEVYYVVLILTKRLLKASNRNQGEKIIYYISAEFLIGKLLSNNLMNLGVYDILDGVLTSKGHDLSLIEEIEPEPSLGHGGLGRLAACFMDSMASLGLPAEGIGLNYHYGLFKQVFRDRLQTAEKDEWIEENSWLTKTDITFDVYFGKKKVTSRLYDIEVAGYDRGINKLRLFDLESIDESLVTEGIKFDKEAIEKNLTLFLYPDDSDEAGNMLRIYQQYFMVSNAAKLILMQMKERQYDLRNMYEHAVIQINDTHPTLIIPELIRILVDDKALTMDEAITVVRKTCAYTNHTILAEALEKWPLEYLEKVVPQLVPVIEELDRRVKAEYEDKAVHIIDEKGYVHMAHIDIHYGFSVNGVAAIHTNILKHTQLPHFYKIYPEKFNNKTNGIAYRRWLYTCNKELTGLIQKNIGYGFKKNADELEKLLDFLDDEEFLDKLWNIKQDKKKALAVYIQKKEGISIDTNSIYDIQIKRLHEYKRQQMNALYIIHKYLEIKKGKRPDTPVTFLFGGKAASAYVTARDIIHLLLVLQEIVNNDPDVRDYMKVVMVENYNVSYAERLIPACDISEQISLASKESSGTGSMKLMLNGAITLGTADGANVEIRELVGDDNVYIFGESAESVIAHYEKKDYNPKEWYKKSTVIQEAVDFIIGKEAMAVGQQENLERLYHELINKDLYMTLLDLEDYILTKDRMIEDYKNKDRWKRMMLMNIAKAGYFSSDKTIREYNQHIWKL